ncbi:hypothetical protein [Allomuricauda sp. d1]|uniref:hypothetical protein n=1 Tax=Allomuricauda sp. d1 TaxID=3136725 RepID=UPI0031D95916
MVKNLRLLKKGVPFLIVGILFIALILLIQSQKNTLTKELSLAITLDLLLTIPLFYFLAIRRASIPKITIIPIMILGLIIGSLTLPIENQNYLNLFKTWFLPVIELTIFSMLGFKLVQVTRSFKKEKNKTRDFYDLMKSVSAEYLPKNIASLFATEIAMVYYGFLHWKPLKLSDNEFSYHKNSGTPALLLAFILIIGVETYILHILLMKWNSIIAWLLTGLSIYTAIQFFAFAKSLSKRPISITDNLVILRYGIMGGAEINVSNIGHIQLTTTPFPKEDGFKKLSFLGELDSHNVVLTVKRKSFFSGIYGINQKFKALGFYVDEPEQFKKMLESHPFFDASTNK